MYGRHARPAFISPTFAFSTSIPPTTPILAVVFLSLCLGSQQFAEGAYWAATIGVGGRHCATACGVLNTGGNVVGGIVALTVPITVEWLGWGPALGTASLFAFVAPGLWLFIRADRAIDVPSYGAGR